MHLPLDASPDEAAAALTDPAGPCLIGVRHHAPSLAAAMPALLDAAAPDVLLVELPGEMQDWLPWLSHPDTEAPVALAAAPPDGTGACAFYPFADFSPELAALRWASRRGVPVVACDLPLRDRAWREPPGPPAGPETPGRAPAPGATGASGERPTAGPVDACDGAPGSSMTPGRGHADADAPGAGPTPFPDTAGAADRPPPGLHAALRGRVSGRPGDDLWDRLVEAAAPGSQPEAVRRAALLTGWALRRDAVAAGGVPALDLRREEWMRDTLAAATRNGEHAAVVVGAFHAPALLTAHAPTGPADARSGRARTEAAGPETGGAQELGPEGAEGEAGPEGGAAGPEAEGPEPSPPEGGWATSLIPYTYALLDERSGYPAGIRDPEWQQLVLEAGGAPGALEDALTRAAVRVCGALRELGHPSGPADAREIARLAGDLARLRGLPAAGRGEFVEAVQTVLAQGEPYGRGRVVARAMEQVLVGTRTGRAAPGAPRCGLAPAVEAELAALGLPGPDTEETAPRDLRLDPMRSDLDRRRELLLRRLTVCGVPYAEEKEVAGTGGADALTARWEARWTPATAAMLAAAGVRGVTSAQAAEGVLRERHRAERADGGPTAAQCLHGLEHAARCGLTALTDERLAETADVLPASATLPELLAGLALMDRIGAGHIAGLGADEHRTERAAALSELLTTAAVRQVDGLTGSEDPADARALLELAHRADRTGGIRLTAALARLAADGTPLMRGAAGAVRVLLGHEQPEVLGGRVASWVDGAGDATSRAALTARLTGLLTAAGPLLEAAAPALEPLLDRVSDLPDAAFLSRLPALRGGFDTLSPAARDRLLAAVEERLATAGQDTGPDAAALGDTADTDPAALATWTRADLTARTEMDRLGLLPPPVGHGAAETGPHADPARDGSADHPGRARDRPSAPAADGGTQALAPADRWRLVLGRRSERLPGPAAAMATALDELYGAGRGEGSRSNRPGPMGAGGGREAPYPGVREWSEELAALFGPGVREEVLAAAAAAGRTDVLAELDPDTVRPSVDLLRTVLAHAGGLPEARLAALRPLVRRLVEELTRQLATRLRPALHGAPLPRPSRRPGGGLDLARTLRANLATARRGPDDRVLVIPERPVFRTRARRAADWRLILVTDVSGSMEASTVWSALTASVLAGVPTLSTHFLAFSTEVLDLTDHVDDPLSLLLEVSVGGGTHIAAGLRHARELVTVPSRTLVVVVSDFEEGYPLGGLLAEVRALVGAGCHVLGCAGLDDAGRPRYSTGVAGQLVAAGMPVAALSPLELARWVGEKIA